MGLGTIIPVIHAIVAAQPVTATDLQRTFAVTNLARHAGALIAINVQNALQGITYNHHPQPARVRVPQVIGATLQRIPAMYAILIAQPVLEPTAINVQNALQGITYNHHPQPARVRVPQVIGATLQRIPAMYVILIAQAVLEPTATNVAHVMLITLNNRHLILTFVTQPVLQGIMQTTLPMYAAFALLHARHARALMFARAAKLATISYHHQQIARIHVPKPDTG